MIGGVTREHIGEAGLDAHADDRELPRGLPLVGASELVGTEGLADEAIRLVGVRDRRRHRHVDVRHARLERAVEDRLCQPGVARVQHCVGSDLLRERRDRARVACVDRVGDEPRITDAIHHLRSPLFVEVGDGQHVDEVAARGDGRDRLADGTGTREEDSHARASGQGDKVASSEMTGRSRASATAGLVTPPSTTLTPLASPGSVPTAPRTPWVASANTYGKVAFVSA